MAKKLTIHYNLRKNWILFLLIMIANSIPMGQIKADNNILFHPSIALSSNGGYPQPPMTSNLTINGNDDFQTKTVENGWEGDGTMNSPIEIKNLVFSPSKGAGISIKNTALFLQLINITIYGIGDEEIIGFYFENVSNMEIIDCSIQHNSLNISNEDEFIGMYLTNSANVNMSHCNVSKTQFGISFGDNCANISVKYCNFENNVFSGIVTHAGGTGSEIIGIEIRNCRFHGNKFGVFVDFSTYQVELVDNEFTSNYNGITFRGSNYNNYVKNNYIHNNTNFGIYLMECVRSIFVNNTISENGNYGIFLFTTSHSNLFAFNSIINNSDYGVYCSDSEDILEEWAQSRFLKENVFQNNNFVLPIQAGNQCYINNSNFLFSHNYWSDHISTDKNKNGIVDSSYILEGGAELKDKTPMCLFNVYADQQLSYPEEESAIWIFYIIIPVLLGISLLIIQKRKRK